MKKEETFPELPGDLKGTKGPILLVDGAEGRIVDLNRSVEEHFDLPAEKLRGGLFDELFHSDKKWEGLQELVLENGCYRDGPIFFEAVEQAVFINVHPLYFENGDPFYALHVDVPGRSSLKEESTDGELFQDRGIQEYLDEIIYHVGISEDGTLDPYHVSPRIVELFGIEASEFQEKMRNEALDVFYHPEDLPEIERIHRNLHDEKSPISLSYRILPQGHSEYLWVEEKIYPRFDRQGVHVENMGILRDVTEQKVVERRLLQREKHFRNLFENNLAGVFRTVPDRTIVSCNDAFVKMLGYDDQEEILGKNVEDIYEGSSDQGSFVRMVLENDGLTGHESKVILRDGRTKYFVENANPIRDDKGELRYIDGTMIDITELKEANLALKESEERYRTLVDAAIDAIFVWELRSGEIVNANQSAAKILKRDVGSILGQKVESLFSEGVNDISKELLDRIVDQEEASIIDQESELLDAEGGSIPVEVNARSFELKGERYVLGLFRDISHWQASQKALRDSEERFRILSQSTIEGILMSKEGRIIDMNDPFVEIFGFGSREELIGRKVVDLIHPDHQKEGELRLHGKGRNDLIEAKGVRKDGTVIDVEAKGEFIPYHGEEIRVTVVHDITQRKRVEKERQERERAMSTLLGNLPGIAYRCRNDPDWTMEFISQGCEELLGFHPEQLIGNRDRSYGQLVHEKDQDRIWQMVQEAVSKGEQFDLQYRIRTASGYIRTVWERGEAVDVDEGTGHTILEGFITDISKRVEYEKELEKSQKRYRDLIENSPYGTILHREGEVIYLNEMAKRVFGLNSIEEAPSRNILDYIDPEYYQLIRERMDRVKKGEDLPFIEVAGTLPHGKGRIEIETKIDMIEYQGEKVFHTAFRDITREKQLERQKMRAEVAEEYNKQLEKEIEEHKRTHKKLKDSQEFTRSVIDSSLDMIIASDPEGRITVFNDAAKEQFGYSMEEALNMRSMELFRDPEVKEMVARSIEEKGSFTGEIQNVDKDGNCFLTYLSATALKDHKGQIIGSMGISRDITEIKRAEEELRKSEEKYRAIYDQAYIGIAQVDLQGNFLNVNQQLTEITGYSEEELKNFNFIDITAERDVEKSEELREELKKSGKDRVSFEKRYVHKNGSLIDLNLTVALVKDQNGDPDYFVSVFEDITERKKNEEELIRSLKEKEVLLREVHHRVKNNLQVISSILSLQSRFVEDNNTLQILQESQNRISSMAFIHESLYRTDEFDSIDMAQYIKELSSNLFHSYHPSRKTVRLEHDLENVELNLDQAIPCGLIINELVSNALKYAFPDQRGGYVRISLSQVEKAEGDEQVSIRIRDNGVGLPEDYEVGASDSLGLQLVSSLLDQLEGEIRLKRDNGTDYLITFDRSMSNNND